MSTATAMHSPLITLTTDFGTRDPYVAAMKGVIWGIYPAARVVDLTHEIGPQDVREAALYMADVVPYFATGTVHVVVVDPGVGGDRLLLAVRMHEQIFLAPDNGVLSWAARGAAMVEHYEVTEPRYRRPDVSATFHGRDILAPAAAHVACGVAPHELGPARHDWTELPWPTPRKSAQSLDGEVLAVDRFGNLISNIARSDLEACGLSAACVECASRIVGGLVRTYADVDDRRLLALVGSGGRVEIAVRNGSAAALLNCSVGAPVRVLASPPE